MKDEQNTVTHALNHAYRQSELIHRIEERDFYFSAGQLDEVQGALAQEAMVNDGILRGAHQSGGPGRRNQCPRIAATVVPANPDHIDRLGFAELWIPTCTLARPAGHPFYQRLNQLLAEYDFDRFVEDRADVSMRL